MGVTFVSKLGCDSRVDESFVNMGWYIFLIPTEFLTFIFNLKKLNICFHMLRIDCLVVMYYFENLDADKWVPSNCCSLLEHNL